MLKISATSGNNCILILRGLKSLDFRPLFLFRYSILISKYKNLISIRLYNKKAPATTAEAFTVLNYLHQTGENERIL